MSFEPRASAMTVGKWPEGVVPRVPGSVVSVPVRVVGEVQLCRRVPWQQDGEGRLSGRPHASGESKGAGHHCHEHVATLSALRISGIRGAGGRRQPATEGGL